MEKAAKRAPPVGGRLQHNVYTLWSLLVALYGAADGGAGIRHGWSFFGKVGGAKSDTGACFLRVMAKNGRFDVVKPLTLTLQQSLGSTRSFRSRNTPKPIKNWCGKP